MRSACLFMRVRVRNVEAFCDKTLDAGQMRRRRVIAPMGEIFTSAERFR